MMSDLLSVLSRCCCYCRGRSAFDRGVSVLCLLLVCLLPGGCATLTGPEPAVVQGNVELAVIQRGWHTEIGVRTKQISGPLAVMGPLALQTDYVLIGYGAKLYFADRDAGADKAFVALFPGESAVNLTAVNEVRAGDDGGRHVVWLHIPEDSLNKILAFVWAALDKVPGKTPEPVVIRDAGSMFYAAHPDYSGLYNCNNWAADALKAGGLPFDSSGLLFSADVLEQARHIAARQRRTP